MTATFPIAINKLYPGVKQARITAEYNRSFLPEEHTVESLAAEIAMGHAFCGVMEMHDCGGLHHGRWCPDTCPEKPDPRHCGRPDGNRMTEHWKGAQHLGRDVDSGNLSMDELLTDYFTRTYATLIYQTISSTPGDRRWRIVFVLAEPITDKEMYRKVTTALVDHFKGDDTSVKDPARFFYGMKPGNGEMTIRSGELPPDGVAALLLEYERAHPAPPPRPDLPPFDEAMLGDLHGVERYVAKAIEAERAALAAIPRGQSLRYAAMIPAAMGLEGLRKAAWLPDAARRLIDVEAIIIDGATANGYIADHGVEPVHKCIAWAVAHASERPEPRGWREPYQRPAPAAETVDPVTGEIKSEPAKKEREPLPRRAAMLASARYLQRACQASSYAEDEKNGQLYTRDLVGIQLPIFIDGHRDPVRINPLDLRDLIPHNDLADLYQYAEGNTPRNPEKVAKKVQAIRDCGRHGHHWCEIHGMQDACIVSCKEPSCPHCSTQTTHNLAGAYLPDSINGAAWRATTCSYALDMGANPEAWEDVFRADIGDVTGIMKRESQNKALNGKEGKIACRSYVMAQLSRTESTVEVRFIVRENTPGSTDKMLRRFCERKSAIVTGDLHWRAGDMALLQAMTDSASHLLSTDTLPDGSQDAELFTAWHWATKRVKLFQSYDIVKRAAAVAKGEQEPDTCKVFVPEKGEECGVRRFVALDPLPGEEAKIPTPPRPSYTGHRKQKAGAWDADAEEGRRMYRETRAKAEAAR